MPGKKTIYTLAFDDIPHFVEQVLIPLALHAHVFTFTGPLGSGKTTMIKEFLRQLGVTETVTSPTFNYVNTYRASRSDVQHFDLYRLASPQELEELGLHEAIMLSHVISCIEWPAVAETFLSSLRAKESVVDLIFTYDAHNLEQRRVQVVTSDV